MKRNDYNRGFTILEVLVSTALFSIMMTVALGALISLNNSNKKAQVTRVAMDNISFALENISRNLRVGTSYHCDYQVGTITAPRACPSGATSIAMESDKGSLSNPNDQLVYRLNNGKIERSTDSGSTFLQLTSDEIVIDSLSFLVTGAALNDQRQPRVTIYLTGTVTHKQTVQSTFAIQTTVTQRLIDS